MLGRITSGLLSRESKGGNNASLVFVLVAGRGHTGPARARLTRIPRAPQDGGQGRHGAGVFPAYRPADCRGIAD